MIQRNFLIIIIIVIMISTIGILLFFNPSRDAEKIENINEKQNNSQIPNLSLTDYDGNAIDLNNFLGKPLIINSWASWCPFCIDELPDFATIQNEFGNQIVIIAINRSESLKRSKIYTDDLKISNDMIYLLDPKDSFYQSIGGFSMPETLFIDAQGNIVEHKRGPLSLEQIRQKTQNLLQ